MENTIFSPGKKRALQALLSSSAQRYGIKRDSNFRNFALCHLLYAYYSEKSDLRDGVYHEEYLPRIFEDYFSIEESLSISSFIREGLVISIEGINDTQEKMLGFSSMVIRDVIFSYLDDTHGYISVNEIVKELFLGWDASEKISIADFDTVNSSLLCDLSGWNINADMYGYYTYDSAQESILNKVKFSLLGKKVHGIDNSDYFMNYSAKFDRICYFVDSLFGYKNKKELSWGAIKIDNFQYPDLMSKWQASSWVNVVPIINSLTPKGKAVLIMPQNTASSQNDKIVREYLIKNGYIEAVIKFSQKINTANVQYLIYLISFGNTRVQFIDSLIKDDEKDINNIRQTFLIKENESVFVDIDRFDSKFSLSPSNYCKKTSYKCELKKVKDCVIRCQRGFPGKMPKEENDINKVSVKYISQADLEKIVIDGEELKSVGYSEKQDDYIVSKPGTIIISKMGPNFKSAILEDVNEGERFLVNANLLILEVKEEEINPYYLLGFLNSKNGIEALRSIASGSSIPIIGQIDLLELEIPIGTKDERLRIEKSMEHQIEYLKAIKIYKSQIEGEKKDISTVFGGM